MSFNFVCAEDCENYTNQSEIQFSSQQNYILKQNDSLNNEPISSDESNETFKSGNIIEITQDNYDNYFNKRTGKIIEGSGISSGDTIKIGNISDRAFVVDRKLTIMPLSQGDVISNGFIHLVSGSDGSTVTNLIINNTKSTLTISGITVGQLHGIWLTHSNNNTISNNVIRIANSGGVYAMPMGWSSNNRIVYNDMKTYVSSVIIMGQCHYNLISHNSLEVLSYSEMSVTNLIYFNPFSHADYSGSPLCLANTISYNYLKGYCNLPMSIILQMTYENHNGTVVANNTIIKGSFGVNLNGNNVSVYGNTVNNSGAGIVVSGHDFTVSDNVVFGESQGSGISVFGYSNSTSEVKNNNITFKDISFALYVNNASAHDNFINISNYGVGISIEDDNSSVYRNKISANHDYGISILGSYNYVDNNIIITNRSGIAIPSESKDNRYFNNTITRNTITSDNYGIYITGLVYNTIIKDNSIITNASVGIFKQITDEESNSEEDNIVNGVILNSTAIVVDDNNFYTYFNDEGGLRYGLENNVIILTFLSNKDLIFQDNVKLTSNKRSNLLYNVSITLKGGADDSSIEGFNFINNGKKAIFIDAVSNITISKNNITEIFKNESNDSSPILIHSPADDINIVQNSIYINSKLQYTYAISAIANNFNSKLSTNALIKDNTIIMISTGVCEAIYTDILSNSDFISNKINIISDDYSYGLAFADVVGRLNGLNVSLNEIVIYSKQMAYLIECHMIDNSTISNNTLYGKSNGIYGIGVYDSDNISISNNSLSIFGGDLTKINGTHDVLGIGCGAISIIKNTNNTFIGDNLIYTNAKNPIYLVNISKDCFLNKSNNYHVLDEENYNVYFDGDGNLRGNILFENDTLLMNNLVKNQILKITCPITISSYDVKIPLTVTILLEKDAVKTKITNVTFVNSTVLLNQTSNILIYNNSILNSIIVLNSSNDNKVTNNNLTGLINLTNSKRNTIESNSFKIDSNNINLITITNSSSTIVKNNFIDSHSQDIVLINSNNSSLDEIVENTMTVNASSAVIYNAFNVKNSQISKNHISINGTKLSAIIFEGNSSSNNVSENNIISFSKNSDDYAVWINSDKNLSNLIIKNYLIASDGLKIADRAVYAPFDVVHSNTPADIYVSSQNGSDSMGDGSEENPYATLSYAIENALNHSTIHVNSGNYTESNITIDKDIFIVTNNGEVVIDAKQSQLFNIEKSGNLYISGVLIKNAHNEEGGSVFINNGQLFINNSMICNSSSFFDNSHPVWENITYDEDGEIDQAFSHDCENSGLGGVILNNGELTIYQSKFYNNLGHYGGVIADFGKTSIESSDFYNNLGVHGGVIFTNSKNLLSVKDSLFKDNTALTTIDYCALRLYTTGWSINEGKNYQVSSICKIQIGSGGVIYTNSSINIENSEFSNNCANYGGVISAVADSFSSSSDYQSKIDLQIKNSTFTNNRANDTRRSIGENNLDSFPYNSGYDGGVVYGTFNKFYINDCEFNANQAFGDGGALYAKANDGQIMDSIFSENIAGISGGALELSKNFIIMRTIISNNSARYGGAVQYTSYSYYGHIQDNLNIYNSTISNNKALNKGGAFNFGSGNIVVQNSNIINNVAPGGSTVYSSGGRYSMDMRYNYWGINNGRSGPDDSVWSVSNNQFRPWYNELINWRPEISTPQTLNPDSKGDGEDINNKTYVNNNPQSTGSSISTGKSISHTGGNGWKYGGNGDGSNLGYAGIGNGHNGAYTSLGLNSYNGQNIKGNGNKNTYSPNNGFNMKASNRNSLSKSNSSSYNPDLASVGVISNAASGVSTSSSGDEGSSNSAEAKSVAKSFEINEINDLISDEQSFLIFLVIAFIVLLLLVIGYKRESHENEEY